MEAIAGKIAVSSVLAVFVMMIYYRTTPDQDVSGAAYMVAKTLIVAAFVSALAYIWL